MSFYRNTYLKSDDWKVLRASKISHVNGRCNLCGLKSASNDVHHVKYRRLYDVKLTDLRVLCRPCHDWVHDLLEKYPKLKKLKSYEQWVTVKLHRNRSLRYDIAKRKEIGRRTQFFGRLRNQLVSNGVVFRFRMPCSDEIAMRLSELSMADPIILLEEYISITGIDPTRSFQSPPELTHINVGSQCSHAVQSFGGDDFNEQTQALSESAQMGLRYSPMAKL